MLEILVDHRGLMSEDQIILALESGEGIPLSLSGIEDFLSKAAYWITSSLGENEGRISALGKLLEAKDLAVKAARKRAILRRLFFLVGQ